MLVLEGVTKRYGHAAALRDVTLRVEPGSVTLLLGGNGAGKTTLLRLLATLEAPSAGRVTVAGHDARRQGPEARRALAYVGHDPGLYDDLTATENLRFFGGFHLPARDLDARVAAALDAVGLAARANDPVGAFSRGMRQRLALARALLPEPRALLLDEPFTGLDAASTARVADLVRAWRRPDRAALLTTHDLPAALSVADRAVILRRGRIVHDAPVGPGDLDALRERLARVEAPPA